jgi:hypothetical protein
MDISEPIIALINASGIPLPSTEYWAGFEIKYLVDSGMLRATTDWRKVMEPDFAVRCLCSSSGFSAA